MDMASNHPEPTAEPAGGDALGQPPARANGAGGGRLVLLAVAASVLAGLGAWAGGEALFGHFQPQIVLPPDYKTMNPFRRSDVLAMEYKIKTPPAETKNAAAAYGLLGGALGGCLGLAGGLARRSVRAGLLAGLAGIVLGLVAGGGMAAVTGPLFFKFLDPEKFPLVPAMVHGAIWVPISMAAGAALGLGWGDRKHVLGALLGGLLGGLLGTMSFEMANALAFPLVRVAEPVPSDRSLRLVAHLGVALCTGLGAALVLRPRKPVATAVGGAA